MQRARWGRDGAEAMTLPLGAGFRAEDAELRFHSNAEHFMVMPAVSKRYWTAANVRALIEENRQWPRYELLEASCW